MANTKTQPKARGRKTQQPQQEAPQQQAATPEAKAPPKPAIELYGFRSGWTGESDVTNARLSRTKIDPARFGMYPQGRVTERDQQAMVALRQQFGSKQFERRNCDAGILRRLMERGLAKPVSNGDTNAANSKFVLTRAGQGLADEPKKTGTNG